MMQMNRMIKMMQIMQMIRMIKMMQFVVHQGSVTVITPVFMAAVHSEKS
jgi:hypothetical protein